MNRRNVQLLFFKAARPRLDIKKNKIEMGNQIVSQIIYPPLRNNRI